MCNSSLNKPAKIPGWREDVLWEKADPFLFLRKLAFVKRCFGSKAVTSLKGQLQWMIQNAASCMVAVWYVYLWNGTCAYTAFSYSSILNFMIVIIYIS